MRRYSTFGVAFSISLLLSGCTVGPKYVKPTVPVTPEFKEQPPDSFKESDIWKRAQPRDLALRGKWWEVFSEPQLKALEEASGVGLPALKRSMVLIRRGEAEGRLRR